MLTYADVCCHQRGLAITHCAGVLSYFYLCPHTTICVRILLYMCPHNTMYVSSYYYMCVLILLCVRILLCVLILLYMCPHTTTCVLTLPYNYTRVLTLLYMRPHTSMYASSQIQDLKDVSEVEYPDQPSCMHLFKLQFPDYYFHKKKTKGGKAPALSLPLEHASSITLAALSAAERATWIEVLRIYIYICNMCVCVCMRCLLGSAPLGSRCCVYTYICNISVCVCTHTC
jgi:hypothetical protein